MTKEIFIYIAIILAIYNAIFLIYFAINRKKISERNMNCHIFRVYRYGDILSRASVIIVSVMYIYLKISKGI
jgi:hypothetical protein